MNRTILGLTLLLALIAFVKASNDRPSNLRLDVTSFLREAKNAAREEKIRKMLRKSRHHRQKMEMKFLRAHEAAEEAKAMKDQEKLLHAQAMKEEMRYEVEKAKTAIRALRKMEKRQRAQAPNISKQGSAEDPTDPEAEAEGDVPQHSTRAPQHSTRASALLKGAPATTVSPASSELKSEITDPDVSSNDVKKLVKKTHENMERKPDHEIIISKGMTRDEVKMNGEVAKKLVKESEDKKPNGEEIVDKQANLEIDRAPNKLDSNGAVPMMHKVGSIFAVVALTFVLVA